MKTQKIAIQGIAGSFHHQATSLFFRENWEAMECPSFAATCRAVANRDASHALMAIENSIAGSLLPNYGLLQKHELKVVGEVYLRIELHLMGLPGVALEDVVQVQSHPVAIRQCVEFFEAYPDKLIIEKSDTAGCAREIRDKALRNTFAIAGRQAADMYGLEIKKYYIQREKENFTRFLVIARSSEPYQKPGGKATLRFHVGDEPGSLARVLNIMAGHRLNLTKIQSVPLPGGGHKDQFYVDLIWQDFGEYKTALTEMTPSVSQLSVLGEYAPDMIPVNFRQHEN